MAYLKAFLLFKKYILKIINIFKSIFAFYFMFLSQEKIKEAEKKLNESIEVLKAKVNNNQGKIILTSRDIIVVEEDRFRAGDNNSFTNYIQTGIINGKLTLEEDLEDDSKEIKMESVEPMGLLDSRKMIGDYLIVPQIKIPVLNKLNRTGFHFSFFFNIANYEDCKKTGIIGFEKNELAPELKEVLRLNFSDRMPYSPSLQKLEILIGEQEITNFAKNYVKPEEIASFFNMMKNPYGIENKIKEHYLNKRKNLAEELVSNSAKLCILNNTIKELEENVLKAKFISYSNDEGKWDNYEGYVYTYQEIAQNAKGLFNKIQENLRNAEKIKLEEYPEINTIFLGIPAITKTKDFLDYFKNEVLVDYKARAERLNAHIRKELG